MIDYAKLLGLGAVIAFMAILYLFAFDKGYEKHKSETERQMAQVIANSREDLINAVQAVKDDEKNIKDSVECNDILNFDLTLCLSK